MGYAGDERGERDDEVQKRAALHGESENTAQVSSRVRCVSLAGETHTGISRASARKSVHNHGFSFVGITVVENECTLSSSAVQVPTRVRKDLKNDADG